jgi:hypothetical protein
MNKDMHIPAGRTAFESATISVVRSAERTELLRCWACGSCRLKLDLVAILEVPKSSCSFGLSLSIFVFHVCTQVR